MNRQEVRAGRLHPLERPRFVGALKRRQGTRPDQEPGSRIKPMATHGRQHLGIKRRDDRLLHHRMPLEHADAELTQKLAARFDFHIQGRPPLGEGAKLVERRDRLSVRHARRAKLLEGRRRDVQVEIGRPLRRRVVAHHRDPVPRDVQVTLQPVGTPPNRLLEGSERVLGGVIRRAAVGDHLHGVSRGAVGRGVPSCNARTRVNTSSATHQSRRSLQRRPPRSAPRQGALRPGRARRPRAES